MANFEDIFPDVRKGRKARRACWEKGLLVLEDDLYVLDGETLLNPIDNEDILGDDWELVHEPTRFADYFVPHGLRIYVKETHPIGSQPEGSVMVPGSERDARNE